MSEAENPEVWDALIVAGDNARATLAAISNLGQNGDPDDNELFSALALIADSCAETQTAIGGLFAAGKNGWPQAIDHETAHQEWSIESFLESLDPERREYFEMMIGEAKTALVSKFEVSEEDLYFLPTTHKLDDGTFDINAFMIVVDPLECPKIDAKRDPSDAWSTIEGDATDKYEIDLDGNKVDIRKFATPERMHLVDDKLGLSDKSTAYWTNSKDEIWWTGRTKKPAKYLFVPVVVIAKGYEDQPVLYPDTDHANPAALAVHATTRFLD